LHCFWSLQEANKNVQIQAAVKEMGAVAFLRTSAYLDEGVTELFEKIIPKAFDMHLAAVAASKPNRKQPQQKEGRCDLS